MSVVFIRILFNGNKTFGCERTHDVCSFVKYCKHGLMFCSHKNLNLNILVLAPQIILTLGCCGISMK